VMRGVGVLDITEVYRPDPDVFELRPFQDRVLELVRLFDADAVVRLRVVGTIAAGEPIEALQGPGEVVEVRAPLHVAQRHRDVLRRHLCPALDRATGDAFEIARLVTPLLAGLKVSGKVPIDLDPWLFAGVALLIARMGVAAFCAEDQKVVGDAEVAAEGGASEPQESVAGAVKGTPSAVRKRPRRRGVHGTDAT